MSASNHYKTLSSVTLLLFRNNNGVKEVLLQRRANTGYCDGQWDFSASGHVEEKETMLQAVVRECYEELGITLNSQNIRFDCLLHKHDQECDLTYYTSYFICDDFVGVPTIQEEKCSQLKWFAYNDLPQELMAIHRQYVLESQSGNHYFEFGW